MLFKKVTKKITLIAAGMALVVGLCPALPVNAAQAVEECVLFAGGDGESIYVDAGHINMNGDIVTNGKFTTTLENPGINGTIYENQKNDMPDYVASIQSQYYNGEVNLVEGDYSPQDFNENISKAMQVEGAFVSAGNNIAINGGALMTTGDVTIDGGSFSCSDAVIYSKEGNIHIATDNFSASALFYAPNGAVYIECGNINMNGCVVARSIEIVSSGGANLNKNQELIKKFGQVIQADEALNDTEDDNYVENREPVAEQQAGAVSGQQGSGNNGVQNATGEQNTTGGQSGSTSNSGQQASASEQQSSEQIVIAEPLLIDITGPQGGENGDGQQESASTDNNSAATVQANEEGTLQFSSVSKQELKNPIDLFILIYQILTGQKGVLIFDID